MLSLKNNYLEYILQIHFMKLMSILRQPWKKQKVAIPNLKATIDVTGIDDTLEANENFEEAYLETAKSKVNLL